MARSIRRQICWAGIASIGTPALVFAQAASPFATGATSLQTNILTILTPIAVILVMALGALAMANRISWAWAISAIAGVAIVWTFPRTALTREPQWTPFPFSSWGPWF